MSIKVSRLEEIVNEEVQLFLEQNSEASLNEQDGFKKYKAQLAAAESELDKMLQRAPGRVSAKAKRVLRKKISDLKGLIAQRRETGKSSPYRKALKRAQNARNRVTKDDYVKGGKVANRIQAITKGGTGKSKAEKTKALNALANEYPKKPAAVDSKELDDYLKRVKSGKFEKDIGGDQGAAADAAEYAARKKKKGYRPKRGSARHVLKKGDFPKSDAPGFDGFDDFYAAVTKNPKAAKLLSRNGRLRKGGMDRRWGPSHRDAYSVLMNRQTGKAELTPAEQAGVKKERGISRWSGMASRGVSDAQLFTTKQERLTIRIEKAKKTIAYAEKQKAAGKPFSQKQEGSLQWWKKKLPHWEKQRNVFVQKAKAASAGKDVGGPVSKRKKHEAEQAALAKQAAAAEEETEAGQPGGGRVPTETGAQRSARWKKEAATKGKSEKALRQAVAREVKTAEETLKRKFTPAEKAEAEARLRKSMGIYKKTA